MPDELPFEPISQCGMTFVPGGNFVRWTYTPALVGSPYNTAFCVPGPTGALNSMSLGSLRTGWTSCAKAPAGIAFTTILMAIQATTQRTRRRRKRHYPLRLGCSWRRTSHG
jgi:hypothetical protein